ncbi:homeobox-containing protein 1 isoform X1 [Misgurnus anguillicaudatus]|uniref:homeobox-containing protein 1 isoform X1 n=1 Tax=Misgurnus anguillicaudatus TaxID=75329 RepID=UPI0024359287|nr:homeobox-containing protein 1 isoform X1 [Misgurnus anguillicaudatus]XP_055075242.1 homeobox-containing protein 1 isoform X1 [Misgurnus anguillicaudatus]
MRQWCLPAVAPRAEPLPTGRVSPQISDDRMECCDVEPRYTIEQIDLLQRLRLSGMTKPQIIQALESLERLDPDHRTQYFNNHTAPSDAPTSAAPAAPSSSSSSSSSLTSATTQTPVMDSALSPSNSYEASPPPLYPSSGVQRSFSYELAEEDWDLEEKVEEYMRRDSNLVKEEIKAFLNNRRISQAIVGQVTGISQSYISQWLLQQGLEMSDSKRRAFYRWYLLERNSPGIRWSENQHAQVSRSRTDTAWHRQRELLMHLLPWYSAQQSQSGATLSMRSLVKEEPDWRLTGSPGDRAVVGPFRLRRGSRFTWRKECQSIMESFFMENQYPDEAKREEIANACNAVIQKPGCKLSEFERVTALKVYNWFANRRKEMKRRANIEAAILESHGIEVPSPSCQSNSEEVETQEFSDHVTNHRFTEQEELLQRKDIEQDASMLPAVEVPSLPSPASQVSDQKLDESKREAAEED